MEDLPGNSHKQKARARRPEPEERDVKPVVTGAVTRRKPSRSKRVREMLFGGSDARSAGSFVLMDLLVPAVRDAISEAGQELIQQLINPDGRSGPRRGGRRGGRGPQPNVPYTSYRSGGRDDRRELSRTARSRHEFDEVILDSRVEAEEVLNEMYLLLEKFDAVTVADFYNLANIEPSFVDRKWGWTDIMGSRVVRMRNGGYLVDLPQPEVLRD